jgi:polyamine oxidase
MSLFERATDTCQQALSNASVHDFLILEYNKEIGGRVAHTTFGNSSAAKAYTIELGANWVCNILR